MRVLVGGIVAGVAMFAWGALSHMALPLGTMGIKSLPGENEVVATLKDAIPEPGLYFFPGMDMKRKLTSEEERAWQRVLVVTLMGLFGWVSISVSHWNWYGFPGSFAIAEGIDQVVGAFLAGLVLAAIVKRVRA